MQALQQKKDYQPSIPYLILLREAIKGGYKATPEEKAILRKYEVKVVRTHPRAGFEQTPKEPKKVEAH